MQEAVRWQIKSLGDDWKEGEVLLTNHPSSGGSHLPDMTVITPVYSGGKPVFYVASRGHHAGLLNFHKVTDSYQTLEELHLAQCLHFRRHWKKKELV
jgi:hypothetical protein